MVYFGGQLRRLVRPSVGMSLLLTLGLLVFLEFALQFRMHLKTGRSALMSAGNELIVRDPETGLRLLVPNRVVRGKEITIRSNALGLRSPDISFEPEASGWRIAFVGASSIYGATTPSNEETVPARLEAKLRAARPDIPIEVINAGIPGYSIAEVTNQLERLILPLRPRIVLFYPGYQNISGSCASNEGNKARRRLPWIELPEWSLLYDQIYKNAAAIREKPGLRPAADIPEFDDTVYSNSLRKLHMAVKAADAELILMTAARGFRRDLPPDMNRVLSRNIRHFAHCLDTDALIAATELFNSTIRTYAIENDLEIIDLEQVVPGGELYFDDGNHFSESGEEFVSDIINIKINELIYMRTQQ